MAHRAGSRSPASSRGTAPNTTARWMLLTPLSAPGSCAHPGRKLRPEVMRAWLPCPLQVLPGRLVSLSQPLQNCPIRLPWGLGPVPLGLGETVHSTPNPTISHKSGSLPSPRPPTMSPKLQWQLQERPKVSFSLFVPEKDVPIGPQKFIPRGLGLPAWEINTSVRAGRKGLSPQPSRAEMQPVGNPTWGPWGIPGPHFLPPEMSMAHQGVGDTRAGRRQTQPDLLHCPVW